MKSSKVLNGRFLILRNLGEGAAGEVVEAALLQDMSFGSKGSRVAIKIYKEWVLANKTQAFRIDREVRAALRVDSPHVVRTYEIGAFEDSIYLVMELLRGGTLAQWLTRHPHPTFAEVMDIAGGIVKGIYALHRAQLVHRDIKPQNILITERGPVILDLGVVQDLTAETVITGREFLGTIRYAAPEYLFGDQCGPTVDVYSFGLILYELATGTPLISEDLYWSKLILEKASEYRQLRWRFGIPGLTLKERIFLEAVLKGCLSAPYRSERRRSPRRLTIEQLLHAVESRVWTTTFNYPIPLWDLAAFTCWPDVPDALRREVDRFVTEHLNEMPDLAAKAIGMAVLANGVLWRSPNRDGLTGDEVSAAQWMLHHGLSDKDDVTGVGNHKHISRLAWQLLLCGHISFAS